MSNPIPESPQATTYKSVVAITTNELLTPIDGTVDPRIAVRKVANFLAAFAAGQRMGTVDVQDGVTTTEVQASGTLTLSTASGTVGGTIGGTAVTVTASGGDTATAAAIATAINANTTVNKWVSATSSGAVVTVTSLRGAAVGNNITLVADGTGVTASGAKLTGGVNPTPNTLTW